MADAKPVGRGRGRFTAAGVQADVEARLAALEDIIADNVDAGRLDAPEVPQEPVAEETPA